MSSIVSAFELIVTPIVSSCCMESTAICLLFYGRYSVSHTFQSDKVIQQILRDTNVSTTMDIYVKTVSTDAANAMKSLETMCN
jgi:hypothetical protein